jgi:hypothetical protein
MSRQIQAVLLRIETRYGPVIGVLCLDGEIFCYTMESLDSQEKFLPPGSYLLKRMEHHRQGTTFGVEVGSNDRLYFLPGNYSTEARGAILLGERLGFDASQRVLFRSRAAFDAFRSRLIGIDEMFLTIKSYCFL